MLYFDAGRSPIRLSRLPLFLSILGIFTFPLPGRAIDRSFDQAFADCTVELRDAGIAASRAAAACGAARYPSQLGDCVSEVTAAGLPAPDVLGVCERSRRPAEVASCTLAIHEALLAEPTFGVLENCGRALLPQRYGTCVVEVAAAAELTADESLSTCLRAGYRPWEIEPRL